MTIPQPFRINGWIPWLVNLLPAVFQRRDAVTEMGQAECGVHVRDPLPPHGQQPGGGIQRTDRAFTAAPVDWLLWDPGGERFRGRA